MKMMPMIFTIGLCLALQSRPTYAAGESGKEITQQERQAAQTPIIVSEVWTVYLDRLEKETVTINFLKGSAELSASDQSRLRELVPVWKKDQGIEKIIVAAWSDQPYPSQESVDLPEAARKLARQRADRVEDFVKKLGVSVVDTYSMAKKPNWFQKALATDSAQIKGVAPDLNVDSLNEERIHRILERKGGPSQAVIILKRKMDQKRQAS